MTGIEKLRKMRNLFDNCTETFNERFSLEELERIYDAYAASGYDICPDQWTQDQLIDARMGGTPKFCDACEYDPRYCSHSKRR